MKNSQFWGSSWFFWKNTTEGLNKKYKTLGHHKYVMIWAVQSSLYRQKSLRKEDSGAGYEQKADWKK